MRNNTKNIRKGVTAILFALIMIASVSVVATASELPILDFDLRQGSGTTIIDSANGIVGTTHGTVWSTDPSGQPVLYFDSPIKWRWQFGAGDHVEIPYHDALNSPHISIEVWVYPMLAGYYTVFAERIRDGEEWRAMTSLGFVSTGFHTGTQPYFGLSFGGVQTNVISPTEITLNEWHHIVGTYDGNDMKLYVDGEHVATEFVVGGPRDTGSNPFYIGHAPSSNHYFNGYYAQFKMYDRALTTEEVAYNFGSPVEAPVANAGLDQTVEQTYYPSADVTLDGSGSNDPDGDPLTYAWTWEGGSATGVSPTVSLPLGTTTITLVVNDGTADSAPDTVIVTVEDTTAPVLTCPADVEIECDESTDPANTGYATATDNCDPSPTITYSDSTSGTCPEAITRTWTATDECENFASCTQTITVVDTTAPTVDAGPDIKVEQATAAGTEVTLSAEVSDICDASPTVTWSHGPTAVFPLGATTVTVTATDVAGNSASDTVVVNVVDTALPEICVTVSPDTLWPANHKMVDIVATVTVSDICDADPTVVLTSVTSNEPDNAQGNGDGNTENDIQDAEIDTEDYEFLLRAERAGGGDGRVYTITYMVTDASGNSASASATVVVPHDMG